MNAMIDVLTGAQVKEFCAFGTRMECLRTNTNKHCDKLHFRKIIQKHTDGRSTQRSLTDANALTLNNLRIQIRIPSRFICH